MSKCVNAEWEAIKIFFFFKTKKCVSRAQAYTIDDIEDDDNNDDGE